MFSFIVDEVQRAQAQAAYDASMKAATDSIQLKIDEAVSGLKANNEELLKEKRTIQQKLQEFSDIEDPKKAREALAFLNSSHDAQLIRDGKVDELIDKRTSQMRSDHAAQLEEVTRKLEEVSASSVTYKGKFEAKMIDDALREAAILAGVQPTALTDVLLRGRLEFSLGANSEVEARDGQGQLRKNKDGIILTPAVYMDSLKELAPHYWPASEGASFLGGRTGAAGDVTAQLAALAAKGDTAGYRKLRDSQKNK